MENSSALQRDDVDEGIHRLAVVSNITWQNNHFNRDMLSLESLI